MRLSSLSAAPIGCSWDPTGTSCNWGPTGTRCNWGPTGTSHNWDPTDPSLKFSIGKAHKFTAACMRASTVTFHYCTFVHVPWGCKQIERILLSHGICGFIDHWCYTTPNQSLTLPCYIELKNTKILWERGEGTEIP